MFACDSRDGVCRKPFIWSFSTVRFIDLTVFLKTFEILALSLINVHILIIIISIRYPCWNMTSCFLHIRQHVCTQLAHFPSPTSRVMCVFLGGASRFKLWPRGCECMWPSEGNEEMRTGVGCCCCSHEWDPVMFKYCNTFLSLGNIFFPLYPIYCCFMDCNRKVKTLQTSDYTINMWFNDSSLSHLFYSQHSKPYVWQYINMCTTWSTIQKKRKKNCTEVLKNCWSPHQKRRRLFSGTILNLRNYCDISKSS